MKTLGKIEEEIQKLADFLFGDDETETPPFAKAMAWFLGFIITLIIGLQILLALR